MTRVSTHTHHCSDAIVAIHTIKLTKKSETGQIHVVGIEK